MGKRGGFGIGKRGRINGRKVVGLEVGGRGRAKAVEKGRLWMGNG